MTKAAFILFVEIFAVGILAGCYRMRASKGGGEIGSIPVRSTDLGDILLPKGYRMEVVADKLTFPSAVTFDDKGILYIIETGYSSGEVWKEPKLIRWYNYTPTVIATGTRNGPWTGVVFHKGFFYVSEGGAAEGGKILRISLFGEIKTLVENLPSAGDHHTNVPVIKDGYIYFGQGTATNSGVVGADNAAFGWLKRKTDFHDIPCYDVTLAGHNYESENVLTDDPNDKAVTGAFSPFGTATSPGDIIKGSVPCTGSIMRIPLEGGKIEVVAWGLRNPFGLALSPEGKLYTTENAFDERGSRPVSGAGDVLWEVKENMWYGWPDFSAGELITDDEEFKSSDPDHRAVKPMLQQYPGTPPKPAAILGVHSSSNGFDFSFSDQFGFKGEAFIAQFGNTPTGVGKVLAPVGFKVVRANVSTGVISDFAVNKGKRNGPASWLKSGGLERPVSVKFDPSGQALYVVDFGVLRMTEKGPQPQEHTGVVWKITKRGL